MMDLIEVVLVASPFANLAPLYEIDPDADVLLIVPASSQDFAPWHEPGQLTVANANGVRTASTTAAAPASRPGLRIKASSKHLTLASRVFRNKLQFGNTKTARQSDGRVHLKLAEGFDPKAVSIVLNALHGRGSKVPKSVDLDTLAQIALFVDRFQLLDAIEIYTERWITKLAPTLPTTYNRDLILWLYTSHVFRHPPIFHTATKTAAAHASGPIQTLGLPIRDKIVRDIDTNRQALLSQAVALVHTTVDGLTTSALPCATHHCDALLLGELIRSLHRHRLVWPRPVKPFPELSFAAVVDGARGGLALLKAGGLQQLGRAGNGREVVAQIEVEPWGGDSVRVDGGGLNGVAVKEKADGARPSRGWGVEGGVFPVTPAASPEPVYRSVGAVVEQVRHECEARRVVARLDGLSKLAEGVEGLVLESSLGYQLY